MTETVLLYLPLQPSVKTVVEELNGYIKLSAEFIGLPTEIKYQMSVGHLLRYAIRPRR